MDPHQRQSDYKLQSYNDIYDDLYHGWNDYKNQISHPTIKKSAPEIRWDEIAQLMENLQKIERLPTIKPQGLQRPMPYCPNGTAAIVLIERPDGMVLAVTRGRTSKVGMPGGVVELDESPVEAAARELTEETGLVIETTHLKQVYQGMNNENWMVYAFQAPYDMIDGQNLLHSNEGAAIWTTWDRLFAEPWGEFQFKVYENSRPH